MYISAVKISVLTIFNAVNRGAELGLASPLTTAASVSFFLDKNCIYLDAERLYVHIKQETFQMHAPTSPQRQVLVKQAQKRFSRTTVNCGQMRCCDLAICQ